MNNIEINEDILLRYIEGTATRQEQRQVIMWIKASPENKQYFCQKKNKWVIEHLPEQKASEEELEEMKRIIRRQTRYKYSGLSKVAAILILPFILLCGYLGFSLKQSNYELSALRQKPTVIQSLDTLDPYITCSTNRGVKGLVELPDGTKVWLNSDSYIRFPVVFDTTYRYVEFSGEGYFEVIPNEHIPMIVKTEKNIELYIYGTSFNLSSYKEDNIVAASLIEGSITVYDHNNNDVIQVEPNTIMIFEKGKPRRQGKKEEVKTSVKWKDGELIFDNTPFAEIIKKLERWYGLHITVTDSTIYHYSFTGHFYSESCNQVLDLVQASSDLHYSIDKNEVIISK